MPIIGLSDFKGEYNIAKNDLNEDKLLAIIERREAEILRDLLGLDLYNELKNTTIAGGLQPDVPELTFIFEPFQYRDGCSVVNSDGIKVMLCNMIYFYIAREASISNTPTGDTRNNSEVSSGLNHMKAITNYNYGINTYQAIQYYIHRNSESYPDYLGVCKQHMGII